MDITTHTHNGIDSKQLTGRAFAGAPLTALTAKVTGSLSSGGAAVLSTADSLILTNMKTRIDELETRLQTLILLQ